MLDPMNPFIMTFKRPNKMLMEVDVQGAKMLQGFDGETGWTQNLDRIEKNASMERSRLAFLLNPQGPLRLQHYFPGMVLRADPVVRAVFSGL